METQDYKVDALNSETSPFVEGLKNESNIVENLQTTENGAVGLKSTDSLLVDLTFKLASFRSNVDEGVKMFTEYFKKDIFKAVRWLAWASDVREGAGERNFLKNVLVHLANNGYQEYVCAMVPIISTYSRWDNLLPLLDSTSDQVVLAVQEELRIQIAFDLEAMKKNKPVSLLAKWMPSVNTSSKQARKYAHKIIKHWDDCYEEHWDAKKYRKTLSKLRAYLDVVEVKACSNRWSEINYQTVPSQANLKYKSAFIKHDNERRIAYLSALQKGEVKINAGVTFPHDIVRNYCTGWYGVKDFDPALEAMWKALPNYELDGNILVVADCSGSMTVEIGNGPTTAIDVCHALAIYFAEHCKQPFYNKAILFSEKPKFIDFKHYTSLYDKLNIIKSFDDCSNTNIEATFDLILQTAIKNNLTQSQLPAQVLIISDMEFDYATVHRRNSSFETLFETIGNAFKEHGYILPKLVFWNVNSRSQTIPMKENEAGVILVSGFSPNILKMVMTGELSAEKAILDVIMSERYDLAEHAFNGVTCGA